MSDETARFAASLRLLNDTLAQTALQNHYFLWGGLLLGWAREERILPWDNDDADFGYMAEDRGAFLAAIPTLVAAGFQPLGKWINHLGHPTEYVFSRDGARFDFFELQRDGSMGRYWVYKPMKLRGAWIELTGLVSVAEFAPFDFLERTWRKPADHEAFLTAAYGAWRVPNPQHNWVTDDPTIDARYLWTGQGEPLIRIAPGATDFGPPPQERS